MSTFFSIWKNEYFQCHVTKVYMIPFQMNKATFMLGYQAFSETKCLYILEILIGTRTKFSHYLTYPRRSTIFGMRRENPRAWRTRLRIHIVNEETRRSRAVTPQASAGSRPTHAHSNDSGTLFEGTCVRSLAQNSAAVARPNYEDCQLEPDQLRSCFHQLSTTAMILIGVFGTSTWRSPPDFPTPGGSALADWQWRAPRDTRLRPEHVAVPLTGVAIQPDRNCTPCARMSLLGSRRRRYGPVLSRIGSQDIFDSRSAPSIKSNGILPMP